MSEWKTKPLSDITSLVIDYRGKTPLKLGANWSDSGYRALSAKNIKTGRIVNEDSIKFVDESLYKKWMKDEVQRGDILITSEAPFGQIYYWNSNEKIVLSQRLFCLRLNHNVDSLFVYYYMTTNEFQGELDGRATGTTVIGLRQPELLKCQIKLPPFEEQHRIATILKNLDDKIENNRKINENLEQQAQALFKSWFINFEPFKDGKFIDSELGLIPEGWRVGTLGDVMQISKVSINPSKQPQSIFNHFSIPAFDNGMLPEKQFGHEILSNKFKIDENMTLFSKLNPRIKRLWFVGKVPENAICSTEFVPFEANKNDWPFFIKCLVGSDFFYNNAMSLVNGATGSHQRFHPQETLLFTFPLNETVIDKFNRLVQPVILQQVRNLEECQRLSILRDTLLPKLMSGEIEV